MERTGGGKDDGSAPPRSDRWSKRKQRKQGAQQKQNQPKMAGRGAVNERRWRGTKPGRVASSS